MKIKYFFTGLLFIFFIGSCTPKTIPTEMPSGDEYGNTFFARAENYYQSNNFIRAQKYYNKYLEAQPNGKMAPAALYKTGSIETFSKNYEKARAIFSKLITSFPESYFVPDARIEILFTLYMEEKYPEVIDRSAELKESLADTYILRLNSLIGDTYMAMDEPKKALFAYLQAKTKEGSIEEKSISNKLHSAIKQLTPSDIISILNRVHDMRALSLLMFQLGTIYADMGNTEDGIKTLSIFIGNFPDHEKVKEAQSIIEALNTRSQYPKYTIGCLLPLSGPYKTFGTKALKGIELALREIENLRIQTKIRLIIKDTESRDEMSAYAVQELYDEGALAIIGPITTAEVAAHKAQELGIPIILFSQKTGLTEIGDYVFRNFLTPEMQVNTLAEYVFKELELDRFAILYPNEKYGTTFMNLFWDEVIKRGGKVMGVEPYDTTHTDFGTSIKKLIGLHYEIPEELLSPEELLEKKAREDDKPQAIVDFDAIFIPEASVTAGLIVPQLIYHDITDVHLLGTNLWHSESMIAMAKKEVQGAIIPEGFFAESSQPHVKSFVKKYEKTFDETPGFIEAIAFDTACLLFKIADRPNVHIREGIKIELTNLKNFQGVTGATTFNETGEAQKDLYLLKIKGKKFVELKHTQNPWEDASY